MIALLTSRNFQDESICRETLVDSMTLALSRDLLWLFAPFVFSIASHASPFFWLVLVHVPTGRGQRCSFSTGSSQWKKLKKLKDNYGGSILAMGC